MNGLLQRFQGSVKIARLFLGSSATSGIYDNASGIRMGVGGGIRLSLPVTAVATTDFTMSIPPGAAIDSLIVYTTTAYGAATDAKISVGSTVGGQEYVAQTSIKAGGVVSLSFAATTAAAAAMAVAPAVPNLNVRITQTGAASATGAAVLVASFNLA